MQSLICSYLRVSTQAQAERESISSQRHALETYFQSNGITPHHQFEDNGVSGGIELHRRPEGSQLYRLVSSGNVRALYVFALDRIGRSTLDNLAFLHLCESNGTRVIGISDNTDTGRAESTLEIELKSVIASQFRRDRQRQTRSGLRRRIAQGKVNNRGPFGFTVTPEGKLEIDEPRAAVMRGIFESIAKGQRTKSIVRELNERKALSPIGAGWRCDTLIYLARLRAFCGEYESGITPRRAPSGGKRVKRDPGERVVVQCPAIVSVELFEEVQRRIEINRTWTNTEQRRFYLLRGLIKCGCCNRSYVGHTICGRKYKEKRYPGFPYYECASVSHRDSVACGNIRVGATRLERATWDEIEEFLYEPGKLIDQLAGKCAKTLAQRTGAPARRELKRLESLKAKNAEATQRLALAIARGIISDDDALSARTTLHTEAIDIGRQLNDLDVASNNAETQKRQLLNAESLLEALRAKLDSGLSEQQKAEVTRRLVGQIVVNTANGRPQIKIVFVFYSRNSFSPMGSASADTTALKQMNPPEGLMFTRTVNL